MLRAPVLLWGFAPARGPIKGQGPNRLEDRMKNWKRYLALALLVCFAVTIVPVKAHADALTVGMIGSIAYGIASSMGINFTAGSATGTGISNYMTGQVESYVNARGGSLSSLFVGEAAINAAGKLVVAQTLYNGVRDFIGWLGEKVGLSSSGNTLTDGQYDGEFMPTEYGEGTNEVSPYGISITFGGPEQYTWGVGYGSIQGWNNGQQTMGLVTPSYLRYTGEYQLMVGDGGIYVSAGRVNKDTGEKFINLNIKVVSTESTLTDSLTWSVPENWGMPQPMPENKDWEGDFSDTPGWAEPQDLPDFLSKIPVAVAENNLEVTGQIVEADTGGDPPFPSPSPSPSPAPSYNKQGIALLIAEIIAIINSLTGDTAVPEEQIEDVAQQITDAAQTLPDAITQTGTQTQTAIQDATQTITDTITQTQTQTQTKIQDATQTITDTITDTQTEIKDVIQDLTDVPDDFEPQKHPLPRGVFPFCIPFDLHDFIVALSATPQTPEVHVPIDINFPLPGGNVLPFHYQFDLDLHDFDGLAQVLRTLEFIAFGVGLLFVTGKVIKW